MPTLNTDQRTVNLTEDEWFERFRPMQNSVVANPANVAWGGCLLETYGPELEHVQAVNASEPGKVWTVIDHDGILSVTNGCHHVNRIGYIITEVPAEQNTFYNVEDPDQEADDDGEEDDESMG